MKLLTSGAAFLIVSVFGVLAGALLIYCGNFLGYAALCLVALNVGMFAQANHWPQRLHIAHLRWRVVHLNHVIAHNRDEMSDVWADDPGGEEWHALSQWQDDLMLERRDLALRIEDLVYKLGRDTY